MRPGPHAWQQPPTQVRESARPGTERSEAEALGTRGEAQQRLLAALQSREHGMTVRQLEAKLSWPSTGVQEVLDGLLETRVIARLNTVLPSYVYRYGGVDLDVD